MPIWPMLEMTVASKRSRCPSAQAFSPSSAAPPSTAGSASISGPSRRSAFRSMADSASGRTSRGKSTAASAPLRSAATSCSGWALWASSNGFPAPDSGISGTVQVRSRRATLTRAASSAASASRRSAFSMDAGQKALSSASSSISVIT